MPKAHRVGNCWPTGHQRLLLRAALLNGQEVINAWGNWIADIDIDAIDPGSYRLLPLVYHNLRAHGIEHPLMNKLKGVHRYTWYKNKVLFKNMGILMQSFQNAGIRTMILKGAAWNTLYYEDYGIRPMADFDILVPSAQAKVAINLLRELNWTPMFPSWDKLTDEYRSYQHAIHFTSASGFDLDLHWHALPICLGDDADDDFWSGSISTQIDDVPTRALNSTDSFMHACTHGVLSWDDLPSIRWVADAMIILNASSDIKWDRFLAQVQKCQLVLPMVQALSYLHEEFNAPIPTVVLHTLQNSHITRSERYVHKARTCPPGLRGPILTFWLHFSNYSLLKQGTGLISRLYRFPRYLQVIWNVDYLWQVPFYMVSKLMRRMRTLASTLKTTYNI
jgi:Uncharacterised nucleotidyltransferase